MHYIKTKSLLMVLALISAGFFGLLAIPSGNLVEPAEAENTRAFAGGDGSIGDPYQISDVDQLQDMSSNYTAHYVLINDIDASATVGWNSGEGFDPIGDGTNKFTGSLDGQGYDITDLIINRTYTDYIGLIGYLDTGGILDDISLIDNNVNGSRDVGGLVGFNYYGTVENCYATGNVNGHRGVGGLVGSNQFGTVSNCYATGNTTGDRVGGIVGYNLGTVSDCYATGNVSGDDCVGGIVGYISSGTVSNCYATGDVSGDDCVGGIVGLTYGTVENCYATGDVSGDDDVGGFVGNNKNGLVSNCYCIGPVKGNTNVSGFSGNNTGTIANCFFDNQTSGWTTSEGGTGKNTMDMMKKATFSAFWDFWRIWGIDEGTSYPYFDTFDFPGGDGTIGNPYWITNVFELQGMDTDLAGHYIIVNDIDASNTSWWNGGDGFDPIGDSTNKFTGSLNGQGYNIADLFINRVATSDVGLFGYAGMGAHLSNISLIDNYVCGNWLVGGLVGGNIDSSVENCQATGNVNGTGDYVGGLVGRHRGGTIENCSTSGNVNGTVYFIGGLVGYNADSTVENCYATGNVSGTGDYIGGLVGYNTNSTVKNCHATGNVSGTGGVGGLIGSHREGTLENCYATGNVNGTGNVGGLVGRNFLSTISNCYATGSVNGTGVYVGGLVGDNSDTVSNCSATGSVTGTGDYVGGLVGYNHDTVENCSATGSVSGAGRYVGGLVGYNRGTVSNCSATGIVTGKENIGGLVGFNLGTVSNCSATGSVNGTGVYVGGLVGYNYVDHSISNCYASGSVSGTDIIGGLVGYNRGTVSNCYATGSINGAGYVGGLIGYHDRYSMMYNCSASGNVSGTGRYIGGLVGRNFLSTISNCYATGSVTGEEKVGGLVGHNYDDGSISNCYASGSISGTDIVGGLVGYNTGTVSNCYATGSISGDNNIGGLVGSNDGSSTVENCFWDIETSGMADSDGGIGKTTSKMKQGMTFTGAGWDFENTWSIWDGKTYPYLNHLIRPAPLITTIALTTISEDQVYLVEYNAEISLPGCINFIWKIDTDATWLTMSADGALSGTPGNDDVGTHEVNISVSDGNGGSDWQKFTIIVENVNDDPIIITTPENTTLEDELYSVLLNATDEDPVELNLTWSVKTNADWLNLNGTYLNGTPGNSYVGTFWVNITVRDGYGGSHNLNYTLVVNSVNDAPIWANTPIDQNITEGDALSLDCAATDMDGDNITYSMETTPTSDITIDSGTGVISWASPVIGTYTATITATDGTIEIQHTFSLTVYAPGEEPEPVENKTDTDGDGMPDEWEDLYGLDPDDPTDAALDLDGDGISNLDEYKQGSDPLVDESVDGSTETEDKRSYTGFCLIAGIILLLIMVVIVVIVVRSRKSQTDSWEE